MTSPATGPLHMAELPKPYVRNGLQVCQEMIPLSPGARMGGDWVGGWSGQSQRQ